MKNKINRYITIAISVTIFLSFYFLWSSSSINFDGYVLYDVIKPAVIGSFFLVLASLFSFFMNESNYRKWVIFTIVFMIISVWMVKETSGFGSGIFSGLREFATLILGTIYLIVSFGVVIYQSIKNRKKA